MSIRIYALSKQINVDSKEILDAIRQLGIGDKGSSLAGLTDEEVVLVKDRLNARKMSRMPQLGNKVLYRPSFPSDEAALNRAKQWREETRQRREEDLQRIEREIRRKKEKEEENARILREFEQSESNRKKREINEKHGLIMKGFAD